MKRQNNVEEEAEHRKIKLLPTPEELSEVSNDNRLQLDIELQLVNGILPGEVEFIPDIVATLNGEGDILLRSIVGSLKEKGYVLEGALISYFSHNEEVFIFCAPDPVPEYISVPIHEYDSYRKIVIKAKIVPYLSEREEEKKSIAAKDADQKFQNGKKKRTKERKIGQVIEQVCQWRKLYNGCLDFQGKYVKLSLEDAATKIGIPKKSLDDYFLQLRLGKCYGFDFNEHKDDNVGALRSYIKQKKEEAP